MKAIELKINKIKKQIDINNSLLSDKANKYGWKEDITKGTITFIFDDFYQSWYDNVWLPIIKPQNIKIGITFCGSELDNNDIGFLPEITAKTLFVDPLIDWLYHGKGHYTFNDSMTENQFQVYYKDGFQYFIDNNINPLGWVVPNSTLSSKWIQRVSSDFNFAFSKNVGEVATDYAKSVDSKEDIFHINRLSLDTYQTIGTAQIQNALNDAKAGKWVVIYGHKFDEVGYAPSSTISDLIAYANANNIEILPPSEAFIKHNTTNIVPKFVEKKYQNYIFDAVLSGEPVVTGVNTNKLITFSKVNINTLPSTTYGSGALTIKEAGVYMVNVNLLVTTASIPTALTTITASLFKNGVSALTRKTFTTFVNTYEQVIFTTIIQLVANDVLTLQLQKDLSADMTVKITSSNMSVVKIS